MTTSDSSKASIADKGKCNDDVNAPSIDAAIQGKIGQKLRESYQRVVSEPIPPRFLELLEQLKTKEPPAEDGH